MRLGIYFACTSEDPAVRPSAKTVTEILDSHEIWHASTENWSRLGDERGILTHTLAADDSNNTETDESSNQSDSVIELSSDEEENLEDVDSDNSSDIEIIEEIPYMATQNQIKPNYNERKEVPEMEPTVEEDTEGMNDKENVEDESEHVAKTLEEGEDKLIDDDDQKEYCITTENDDTKESSKPNDEKDESSTPNNEKETLVDGAAVQDVSDCSKKRKTRQK